MPLVDLTPREIQELLYLLNSNILQDNEILYTNLMDKLELTLDNFNEYSQVPTDPQI